MYYNVLIKIITFHHKPTAARYYDIFIFEMTLRILQKNKRKAVNIRPAYRKLIIVFFYYFHHVLTWEIN